MHVSLQLTSHTGPDITKIWWWTRGETTSRGIASPAELLRENYFFELARGRKVGSRVSTKRDFTLQSPSCTSRAYISTYSLCARTKVCRGSSKGVSNTVLTPSFLYMMSDKVCVTEATRIFPVAMESCEVSRNLAQRSHEIASRFTHAPLFRRHDFTL